jgi:hypothetical protein
MDLRRQVVFLDDRALATDHGIFNSALELADVPRPVVFGKKA